MKILAAVDRSQVSDAVIELVIRLARGGTAQVLVINVAPREADVLGKQVKRKVITSPVPAELHDHRALLDRHCASLSAAGVACESLLIRGEPAAVLLSEAQRWGADLIVMGTHGRGALYRQLMGSVSEAVLRARRFPVLVLPAGRSAAAKPTSPQ